MNPTIDYYDRHAAAFFRETTGIDMAELQRRFTALLPAGGLILDAGCGSGRDSLAFREQGFRVAAFDASPELARLAGEHVGQPVAVRTFAEVSERDAYDGIWACASLLHLPRPEIPDALTRLWAALKPGGVMYVSFKEGQGEREKEGRHFTDLGEHELHALLDTLPDTAHRECWTTPDNRPNRAEIWLNALVRRRHATPDKLITGGSHHPFLPALMAAIRRASEIDLAVAFIKTTGLRLLLPELLEAVNPAADSGRPPVRLRIITSDYLDITDPEALRLLMLLQERGALVRLYETSAGSFHLKAYLFLSHDYGGNRIGTAFIGSSNISRQALQDGLEWNYRIDASEADPNSPEYNGFHEARSRFEELFAAPVAVELDHAWVDAYEQRRRPPLLPVAPGSDEREKPPQPSEIQHEALAALVRTRENGYRRGLVVMATGLGKTWLAAFDSSRMNARRLLFVAHRQEILLQAEETMLRIRPKARVGFYTGQAKDQEADILCASIQTLGRLEHLKRFAPDHFDYIVVDEFHHAAAITYRRLLAHFRPRFLLGLTATPDRTDQSDILSLCDDNLVFTCDLLRGINGRLLVPFHYYGIYDQSVDYQAIPWRSGRFDPDKLSHKLATLARARHAFKEWRQYAQRRTLAFCASIRHAEFMARSFQQMEIAAAAVYGGSTLARGEALEQLAAGKLQVLFTVDLFNEGVDLPAIDTVMLLRPTESKILFLQQLGRGLRKDAGKEHLVILDFIGNHHAFFHKPQALFQAGSGYRALADFARKAESGNLELPKGCYVNYDLELIRFLKELDGDGARREYEALRDSLGRRPSLSEFYRSGAALGPLRRRYGHWFAFVEAMNDLDPTEKACAQRHADFLREVETTQMTRSFKMILLEALLELDGFSRPPEVSTLANQSLAIFQRRRQLISDLRQDLQNVDEVKPEVWRLYWQGNPIRAWTGGNRRTRAKTWFSIKQDRFLPAVQLEAAEREVFTALVQELADYRHAAYETRGRTGPKPQPAPLISLPPAKERTELPYFPNLRIACGHFKTGRADAEEYLTLGPGYGKLDPAHHFIARAVGNSMNGGKNPIRDGDYLLLEHISPASAGSISNQIMAVERQEAGDDQYLLRQVIKTAPGYYLLRALNPDYQDLPADDTMHTFARLKAVMGPQDLVEPEPV